MRKISFILSSLLLVASFLLAQAPLNDECATAIPLGKVPACPSTVFSNSNATPSNIGSPNNAFCPEQGNIGHDVWFTFQTTTKIFDYNISVQSTGSQGIASPNINIYRGDCGIDQFSKLCLDTTLLSSAQLSVNAFGLTQNVTYYIRVSDSQAQGNFKICVSEYKISTIANTTTTACNGTIYDSGGPDKTYKNGENFVFKICPDEPHQCIKFTLTNYNIAPDADEISFYNGDGTSAPLLRKILGSDFNTGNSSGGVAFDVYASAKCLTMTFKSDADGVFEGFEGKWQCTQEACPNFEDINFTINPAKEVIEKAVARPGTDVTLKTIKCGNNKGNYGLFKAQDDSELGLGSGIVLSSGAINKINLPALLSASTDLKLSGDADLDSLSLIDGGGKSLDACVVEFEVFANSDELRFDYVFASEEYPDFIHLIEYNDAFALMIEGPGIIGDNKIAPKKNLARLPNGKSIGIAEVNSNNNYEYYRNNLDGQKIIYNGMTADKGGKKKTLTAKARVIPCQTYKLKMAIADRKDPAFDSGVFIGDIRGNTPEITLQSALGLNDLVEICSGNNEQITFKFENPLLEKTDYIVEVSGTATADVDYTLNLPKVLSFAVGATVATFPIKVIADNIVENNEYIEITILRDYGCGLKKIVSQKIYIKDNLDLKFNVADTVLVCGDVAKSKGINLSVSGATSYNWSPTAAFSEPSKAQTNFKPSQSGWYKVTGKTNQCSATDSIYANVISPTLKISALSKTTICEGETIALKAENNFADKGLLWSPNLNYSSETAANTSIKPNVSGTAIVNATVGGCAVRDTFNFVVNQIGMPLLSEDTTVCFKQKTLLANVTFAPNTTFTWTPSGPANPKIDNVYITPTVSQTYILKGETDKCVAYDTVKIAVLAKIDILSKDTIRICKGSSFLLEAELDKNVSAASAKFVWKAKFATFANANELKTSTLATKTGWIFAEANNKNCMLKDSIFVIVDSLPNDLSLNVFKKKPFYCPGDTILLYSNGSMPKNLYPKATFQWQNPLGAITPADKANLKIITDKPYDYIRKITNGVCERLDTFKAIVLQKLPNIALADVTICPGEIATFDIKNANDFDKFEWKPADKLSCSDCPKPSTTQAGTYNVTGSKTGFCPSMKAVKVIQDIANITINSSKSVFCESEKIESQLNVLGATNIIWSPADGLSCTNCVNPIATKTGIYTAKTNATTCNSSAKIEISQVKKPFDLTDIRSICDGENAIIALRNSSDYDSISLTPKANTEIIGNKITISKSGTYILNAKTKTNNCTYAKILDIRSGTKPIITITASPNILTFNKKPVTLTASGTNLVEGTLLWQDLTGSTVYKASPKDSLNTYSVTGQSSDGCAGAATIKIYNVAAPSIFIAGENSKNGAFQVVHFPEKIATFKDIKIFDRWGHQVYQSDKNDGWDGGDYPSDVYIYYVTFQLIANNEIVTGMGDVTLMR